MRKIIAASLAVALAGASLVPAAAVTVSPGAARSAVQSGEPGLFQTVQVRKERRDVRRSRREVRRERRDVRRADSARERRRERQDLREARRDRQRERRDLREARQDRRYYSRNGRRYYRDSDGAEIFAGIVGSILGGAIAAGRNADAYCERRFRSYDRRTGTYLGYDGRRHPCP